MRRFDAILIVDWSSSASPSPARHSANAIWTGLAEAGSVSATYHRTRAEAERAIQATLGALVADGRRALVGFDFAFGYPQGFAAALSGHAHAFAVWDWLEDAIEDGPENANNRFEVADRINAGFPGRGPFWGHPQGRSFAHLSMRDEREGHGVAETLRQTERAADGQPKSVFKIAYAGSVGGQSLVGLPLLARLRRRFEGRLGAWPFEAHALDREIVLAEVYPSLIRKAVPAGGVRDEAQVRQLAAALARLDREGRIGALFAAASSGERLHEEGWILGVGAEPLLRAAAEAEGDLEPGEGRPDDASRPGAAEDDTAALDPAESEAGSEAPAHPAADRSEGSAAELEAPHWAPGSVPAGAAAGAASAGRATAPRAASWGAEAEGRAGQTAGGVAQLRDDCFALPPGVAWTPVDEALARLRSGLGPVTGVEEVEVSEADGRILAAEIRAARSNPPAANAAVDGYGFAHPGSAGSLRLPLLAGRAAAGAPFAGKVPPGTALRILTGALLPEGVDTVVLQEAAVVENGHLLLPGLPKRGANARAAGEDVEAGAAVLAAGRRLGPADLALVAAVGVARVAVRARLAVGVLSTGDEVVAAGAEAGSAGFFDANRPMLLALLRRWGHAAVDLGHVGDDRAALAGRLDGAAALGAILTTGGASAGDEDHLSALLGEAGTLRVWRVAMKPGRPLALGLWQGVPVFGLPGNPVAAFVTALVFARPALAVLAGGEWPEPAGYTVPAAFAKRKKAGRREYLRARLTPEGAAEAFPSEGSGRISGLAWATGLVELPDAAAEIAPGDPLRFLPYGSFGL